MGLYFTRYRILWWSSNIYNEQFENINGYHMDYWGWGMEDDDLFWRCVRKGYFKEELIQPIKQKMVLELDGKSTYIESYLVQKL